MLATKVVGSVTGELGPAYIVPVGDSIFGSRTAGRSESSTERVRIRMIEYRASTDPYDRVRIRMTADLIYGRNCISR